MTETSPKKRDPGCVSKILWVFLLMLTSAAVGWLFGKTWLDRSPRSNPVPAVFAPSATTQDWQQQAQIRQRRAELAINAQFFKGLVNEVLTNRYPDLSTDSADKRGKRSLVSLDLLDRLAVFDTGIRQGLGTFDRQQRQDWIAKVNDLHLSSRVLNLLTDNAFFAAFPEETERPSFDRSLAQVWSAFALTRLQALQSGQAYQAITSLAEGGEAVLEGSLAAGEGKAYAIELRSKATLTFTLETEGEVFLYFYSPTGRVKLLEKSLDRQWAGNLPETGFYELVLISKSTAPITFRLNLQVAKP